MQACFYYPFLQSYLQPPPPMYPFLHPQGVVGHLETQDSLPEGPNISINRPDGSVSVPKKNSKGKSRTIVKESNVKRKYTKRRVFD